jgi:phosphonopyruvate decarboxylase
MHMIQLEVKIHMLKILIFEKLSKSLGFNKFYSIKNKKELNKNINKFLLSNDLCFLEVKTANSSVKNLPRPIDLIKIKNQFMKK